MNTLWPYTPRPEDYSGVNPPISDSATYAFPDAQSMIDAFHGEGVPHFLYSRHSSPSNQLLEQALAALEGTASAAVFGSGMGAITSTLMQLCRQGDHIVSSRTIYGGTYAFMKNFLPRLGIRTTFVDIGNVEQVREAVGPHTRLIYAESLSNPLLRVANLPSLGQLAREYGIPLVVDNTFSPLVIRPAAHGADIVLHSLTKFINGNNDTLGGVVCASQPFVDSLKDVNEGAAMLYGSTLDAQRAGQILKNLQTLPLRMRKHGANAAYLAGIWAEKGYRVSYPGLTNHPDYPLMSRLHRSDYGYGGMVTLDAGRFETANHLMQALQREGLGFLAVSLGFHKTLFSASGTSTSSEIPPSEREGMGLSDGLVRFSIGLDEDIEETGMAMQRCFEAVGL